MVVCFREAVPKQSHEDELETFLVLKRDIKTWNEWQTKSFILHAACLTVCPVACGCWYCGFDMSGPDQFLVSDPSFRDTN